MAVKMVEGAYYKDGYNEVIGPIQYKPSTSSVYKKYPWICPNYSTRYTSQGIYDVDDPDDENKLIERVNQDGSPYKEKKTMRKKAVKKVKSLEVKVHKTQEIILNCDGIEVGYHDGELLFRCEREDPLSPSDIDTLIVILQHLKQEL